MSYNKYVEGKYSCNHPESDFANNSDGPIEMKKENFTEYTHRNETSNMQYDVWSGANNTTKFNINNDDYNGKTNYSNGYSNKSTKKSNTGLSVFVILFIIYGLPMLLSLLFQILDELL